MAILRSVPQAARSPSYRGRVIIYAQRGVLRVAKWPRKRGTPKSAKQRWWNDWFTQANLLAKYADPMSQARAIQMTKGSGLYPRDVLLEAMRGRLYWWADETGWKWFPMAATQDVSNSLDTVAQVVGSILVRALDRWRAPALGNLDEVLTLKGPDLIPEWAAPGGGGTPFGGALVTSLSNQAVASGVWAQVIFDAEQYDTDSLHDNAVDPTRLTVPAGWSRVRLFAGTSWQAGSNLDRIMRFLKNGAGFPGDSWVRDRAISNNQNSTASPAIVCVPGDYFELSVLHGSVGNLNILGPGNTTYFAMERVT